MSSKSNLMQMVLATVTALGLSAALAVGALAQDRFPSFTFDDLNGQSKTIPRDFPGDPTIVFIAYKQRQQGAVNTWIAELGLDASMGPEFIELPVVGTGAKVMRSFIDNGMRSGIVDPAMRARTVTIYDSPSKVNDPLGFSGRDDIRVLLVRPNGEVIWKTSGPATAQAAEALRAAYLKAGGT